MIKYLIKTFKSNSILSKYIRNISIYPQEICKAPFVKDEIVNVTLVDYDGNRRMIQGRSGQTLVEACQMNGVNYVQDDSSGGGAIYSAVRNEDFTEELFGEGPVSPVSHVVVSNEWIDKLPPPTDKEIDVLTRVPEEDFSKKCSRLGTEIVLTKELNGIVIATPDPIPIETYSYEAEDR